MPLPDLLTAVHMAGAGDRVDGLVNILTVKVSCQRILENSFSSNPVENSKSWHWVITVALLPQQGPRQS